MKPSLAWVTVLSLGLGLSTLAQAEDPTRTPTAAAVVPVEDRLSTADAAVDAGNLAEARIHYQRLVNEFPNTPEATQARRALRILDARLSQPVTTAAPVAAAPVGIGAADKSVVIRQEPYSLRTSERLRLSAWEKLDFGTTAFLYGMSVGFSYSLSLDNPSSAEALTPIALGGLAYTLGAVGFLNLTDPDRGDLPLALAIASYLPTTTLLAANAFIDQPDEQKTAAATAIAGLLSIPVALIATRKLDLDPGDTQLVRDAGFWGLALGTLGTLGFGGTERTYPRYKNDYYSSEPYTDYEEPTPRRVSAVGLIGLYGGLGLGLLTANAHEISLERVRISTWGGYGGGVLGLLLGGSISDSNGRGLFQGATLGALTGLIITFLSTSKLDGIPDEEMAAQSRWTSRLVPSLLHLPVKDGHSTPGFGISGTL